MANGKKQGGATTFVWEEFVAGTAVFMKSEGEANADSREVQSMGEEAYLSTDYCQIETSVLTLTSLLNGTRKSIKPFSSTSGACLPSSTSTVRTDLSDPMPRRAGFSLLAVIVLARTIGFW